MSESAERRQWIAPIEDKTPHINKQSTVRKENNLKNKRKQNMNPNN